MIATTSAERAEFLSGQGVEQASGKRQEPSEKAFEVFHLVEIVGISTREAAEQVGISHTRVVQLRDAVERWIGAQPSRREKLTKEQRLRVAEYKAELRLDHLYSLALGAWRSSQGQEFVQRGGSDGSFRTVVRHCHGKANYLNLASRIVLAQAKLAISMAKAADDRSGDRGDANDASNPPEEDCSVERDAEAASDETQPAASEASADPDATCDVSAAPVVSASCENRRG
jgi:hypothetical protein